MCSQRIGRGRVCWQEILELDRHRLPAGIRKSKYYTHHFSSSSSTPASGPLPEFCNLKYHKLSSISTTTTNSKLPNPPPPHFFKTRYFQHIRTQKSSKAVKTNSCTLSFIELLSPYLLSFLVSIATGFGDAR